MNTPTERNPQETKQKILRSALDEFCRHGLHGARIDKIVSEAGVNKRMIYHYFESKEGLFYAVFQQQLEILKKILELEPDDTIEAKCEHWLNNSANLKGFLKLSSWIEFTNLNEFMIEKTDTLGLFSDGVEVCRQMQKEGKISKKVKPEVYLIAIIALTSFPIMLPNLVKFISKNDPSGQVFLKDYFKVIQGMVANKI